MSPEIVKGNITFEGMHDIQETNVEYQRIWANEN